VQLDETLGSKIILLNCEKVCLYIKYRFNCTLLILRAINQQNANFKREFIYFVLLENRRSCARRSIRRLEQESPVRQRSHFDQWCKERGRTTFADRQP
jgi:hypothetical protein